MNDILFIEKTKHPDSTDLKNALGNSYKLWTELRFELEILYCPLIEEWKYYNSKSGWILKLLKKKRNLFFFKPCRNFFTINFTFGDKAVNHIQKSNLPDDIIDQLLTAQKYAEGRSLSVEVRSHNQVEQVLKLVDIKINN